MPVDGPDGQGATRGRAVPEGRPGAGGGLGGSIARELPRCGFDLVFNDLVESDALAGLCADAAAFGGVTRTLAQDICDVGALDAFVSRAHATFGRLDSLVSNAVVSVLSRGDILDVTPESFDRCVAVNLRAILSHAARRAPHARRRAA